MRNVLIISTILLILSIVSILFVRTSSSPTKTLTINNTEARNFVAQQYPQYSSVSFERETDRTLRGHYDLDNNDLPIWGFFVEVESQDTLKIFYYLNEDTISLESFENPLVEKRYNEFLIRVLNKSLRASDEPVDCGVDSACSVEKWQLVQSL